MYWKVLDNHENKMVKFTLHPWKGGNIENSEGVNIILMEFIKRMYINLNIM